MNDKIWEHCGGDNREEVFLQSVEVFQISKRGGEGSRKTVFVQCSAIFYFILNVIIYYYFNFLPEGVVRGKGLGGEGGE